MRDPQHATKSYPLEGQPADATDDASRLGTSKTDDVDTDNSLHRGSDGPSFCDSTVSETRELRAPARTHQSASKDSQSEEGLLAGVVDTPLPISELAPDSLPMSEAPVTVGYTRIQTARVGEFRRSSAPPPAREEWLRLTADLLLAAAHIDGNAGRRERHSLRKIEARIAGGSFPPWLNQHIANFDPTSFDLEATCRKLCRLPLDQRRYVAELVREISEADNEFTLAEERFLSSVITALELDPNDHQDLVFSTQLERGCLSKRAFDIVFSALVCVLLSPMLLAIAIGVKLSSKGPVLFKQRRYGKDGTIIHVYKFRSMRATEDGAVVKQAQRGDPRITAFGAFLRRSSLDELPQFFNVLLGSMSVVGPRPHAVAHNEEHRTLILEYMLRHKIKPGITGWAQVNGFRGETDTLDKMLSRVEYDLHYIQNYSFWLDLKIVWLTVFGKKVRSNAY